MRKHKLIPAAVVLGVVLLILLLFGAGQGGDDPASVELLPEHVPGELLVKFKPRLASGAVLSSPAIAGVTTIRTIPGIGAHHVKLPTGMSVQTALHHYRNHPDVEYAEPNYIYKIHSTVPNDTFFTYLWGLRNTGQIVNGSAGTPGADIQATSAWDLSTGSSAVIVAVIDTGVDYNHPDLAANMTGKGYDFVQGDADALDYGSTGHGTHVAGTIAAVGNNGTGITGVGWKTKILAVRAGDTYGYFTNANIASAIGYAVSAGAKIINASFGGNAYSTTIYNAIAAAKAAGILFIAAAGNDGTNNDTTSFYPAGYDLNNIIAVAATDQNDYLCYFSNYGASSVHVAAPGQNIYSTKPARQTLWSEDFENGIGSWTLGGTNNTWGITGSQYYSGYSALAVNPGGNYLSNTNSWISSPAINLSGRLGSQLLFYLKGKSQSNKDFLYIDVRSGATDWVNLAQVSGDYSSGWYIARLDLSPYDGQNAVFIRFRFVSDSSTNYMGWYIDDVSVTAASSTYNGTEYQFKSGTSMATPHVVGLAALIWGYKPGLTYLQVRDAIFNSVDTKSSLTGKMSTGGRINALKALLLPDPPASLSASAVSASRIDLTWSSSGPASGFKIYRKSGSTGTWSLVSTTSSADRSYSDTGVLAETTYYYRITSYNGTGDSPYSNECSATTPAVSLPNPPYSLSASAVSASRIDLTWSISGTAWGFKIYRKPGSTGTWSLVSTAASADRAYTDTGVLAETTYYYRLASYNETGDSPYSNECFATTPTDSLSSSSSSGNKSESGGGGGGGGGCFIATAAFGSPAEKHVRILRDFRDRFLLTNATGRKLVAFYYRTSPPVADAIRGSSILRATVRVVLMPAIGMTYMALYFGPVFAIMLFCGIAMAGAFLIHTVRFRRLLNSLQVRC